ncbi:hypothetical protein ACJX0J_017389, partial [Zea mays]
NFLITGTVFDLDIQASLQWDLPVYIKHAVNITLLLSTSGSSMGAIKNKVKRSEYNVEWVDSNFIGIIMYEEQSNLMLGSHRRKRNAQGGAFFKRTRGSIIIRTQYHTSILSNWKLKKTLILYGTNINFVSTSMLTTLGLLKNNLVFNAYKLNFCQPIPIYLIMYKLKVQVRTLVLGVGTHIPGTTMKQQTVV